jgi:hypothetical protein
MEEANQDLHPTLEEVHSTPRLRSRSSPQNHQLKLNLLLLRMQVGTFSGLISRGFTTPPACLGQDYKSTIQVICNGIRSGRRLKHQDNKIFFLKDYIEEKQLIVDY